MKRFILIFLFALLSMGCGSEEDSKLKNHTVVNYELDKNSCLIRCNNVSDSSSFISDAYSSFDCTWYCSTYKDKDKVYVNLTFSNNNDRNSCLRLQSEYISDGICIYE